jgi:hypothetical protein
MLQFPSNTSCSNQAGIDFLDCSFEHLENHPVTDRIFMDTHAHTLTHLNKG